MRKKVIGLNDCAVYFNCDTENARVYYTTDGTTPDESSEFVYGGSGAYVSESCTIKAVAYADNMKPSKLTAEEIKVDGAAEFRNEVLRLVNIERANVGLSALKMTDKLNNVAQIRAEECCDTFAHERPDGRICFTALDEANISYRAAGENIAAGQCTPADVVDSWMNSPGHRANILKAEFTTLGVGVFYDADSYYGTYWAQMFVTEY